MLTLYLARQEKTGRSGVAAVGVGVGVPAGRDLPTTELLIASTPVPTGRFAIDIPVQHRQYLFVQPHVGPGR